MTTTKTEIDDIVRRVLSRLADLSAPAGSVESGQESVLTHRLENSVITEACVAKGIPPRSTISVRKSAVITPAAWDVLRRNQIEVKRESVSRTAGDKASTSAAPMFVLGRAFWLSGVQKRFCPKQVHVDQVQQDDAPLMNEAIKHLRGGSLRGVILAEHPYAMSWQAARYDAVRSAVVASWSELPEVIREVPVNLIILNQTRWNAASTSNLIRAWQRSLGRA